MGKRKDKKSANREKDINLEKFVKETKLALEEIKREVNSLKNIFDNICYKCGARCCKYVIYKLSEPEDIIDIEELRWLICHKNVLLSIDNDQWELIFLTECEYLDPFGRCRIYEKRPDVCKDYSLDECEYLKPGDFGDIVFRTLEELDDYLKENYKWWWKEKKKERNKE